MQTTLEHGMALHGQGRLGEAEAIYRSLLARDPRHFDALHLLGLVRFQQGHTVEAHELIGKAVKIKPRSPQALAVLTAVLLALGRAEEALVVCERILTIDPNDLDSLYNRAVLLTRLRRFEQALAAYDKVLARDGTLVDALCDRGNVLAELARFEEAIGCYDKVLARAPGHVGALHNRGSALASLGRHADALVCFDKVLAISPVHVDAMANSGAALKQLGREEEALACYTRALALDPGHLNSLLNRGNALLRLNRLAEALDSYERVLAREPAQRDALLYRGHALRQLSRLEEAIAAYGHGLARHPQDEVLLANRADALCRARRFDAAIRDYERALELAPDDAVATGGLINALQESCCWDRLEAPLQRLTTLVDAGRPVDPLLLIRVSDDPSRQFQCARNYVRATVPAIPNPLPPIAAAATKGRLRVAYLSAGFGGHAMAHLTARLFELHDRSRFETIAISLAPDDRSAMRGRLVRAFDRFEDVTRISDLDVARLLRGLEVDIAVDLMGHTENNRFAILAHRPAPIQVSYMGLPGTTGADFIDYFMADRIVLPFDQQSFFSERIVHLPDTYWVIDSTLPAPISGPPRSDLGLPKDAFVFCSFNQSYKITAAIFDIWMRLLQRVEGSVLWLLDANAAATANLRARAEACGVAPGRLVFAPRADIGRHLARHRAADLFLDTLPVNAHTTASDALWMGLPVVTCGGRALAGRVATSLLHAVGLPELVTASLEQYEALALELATDRDRLDAVRRKIEAGRLTHPLFDTDRFRRHIEAAYLAMWEIWQRGESPHSFAVEPIAG
jgi:protein O-GlcNAc transferase